MTFWQTLWKDPVWSKVIAGAILVALGAVGTYVLDWWPVIAEGFRTGWRYIQASSSLPNWVIGALALLSSLAILLILGRLITRREPERGTEPWRSYTSDEFFGLRWRWHFQRDGVLTDLHTHCPHCDYQVLPAQVGYAAVGVFGFRCDSCGQQLPTFNEPIHNMESKVARLIVQKLRTNSWSATTSPKRPQS